MTFIRRSIPLLLALLLVLSGCQPAQDTAASAPPETTAPADLTPVRSQFALAWDPNGTLDPLQAGSTNLTLSTLVFQGLFALDQSFTPTPVLCQSYTTSEDGLVWTFTLRRDLQFSDGLALDAVHAAHCLNAARFSSLYAARLARIIEVTGEGRTLTITLASPSGALPALLDIPIYRTGEDGLPLGTGPYRFRRQGADMVLESNPHYREEQPPLASIPLRATPAAEERLAAFDTGSVTLVNTDLTNSSSPGYAGNYESWDYPTTTLLYLGFNLKSGPCSDPLLRQAVSRGIDRSTVVAALLSGHADAAQFPFSPHSSAYDPTLAEELDYSIAAAQQLLSDGGYTMEGGQLFHEGEAVALTLAVNTENTFKTALADYLAQELAKLGLAVTVEKLPWWEYTAALQGRTCDLYLGQVRMTADFDPTALLTGSLNYGGYYSAAFLNLLSAYRAASGDARDRAAYDLCVQLATDMPIAPLCFQRGSVLTQWGSVSGLSPTQQDPFYHMYQWTFS